MNKMVDYTCDTEGIAVIRLNRQESANALSAPMLHELRDLFRTVAYDRSVRCIIVTGSGEKVFCAGADLKERARMDIHEARRTVSLVSATLNELGLLPKPTIAAVNGMAIGGGAELAMACDIRVAAETAKFAMTETSLGIIPGGGGTQRLPRLVGLGRAKELIFTARRIDASEAKEIGLVEFVVPAGSVMVKSLEIARQIANNAPIAITQAKFAINNGYEVDLQTGIALERSAYEATIPTSDRLEGLQAFKEKRAPVYKGE